MSKKLISFDPVTKKKTWLTEDVDGLGFETQQDTSAIVDAAKAQEIDWRPGQMIGNTQKHQQKVAEIPNVIYYDLLKKFGDPKNNPKAWKAWLNDADNRAFRTTGGSI